MAHVGRCAAAAEVCNLIELIHRSAGFRQNRAAAGDKAPCIEITAVLDCNGAVIRHFDVSIITNGTSLLTTASRIISAAQADGTIDGNRSAIAHRQRSERLRSWGCANCRRSIRIQRSRLIKRDQQCDSSRNGIAAADRAIGRQGNLGLTVCLRIGNRIAQLVKALAAGLKECHVLTDELRRNGAVAFDVQRGLWRSVDVLSAGHIIPAHELIARRRSCSHLIGGHGALGVGVGLGDGLPVHGIAAVLGGLERHCGGHVGHQRHTGHGDLRGGAGAAGLDIDLDEGVRRKLFGEFAACGDRRSVHLNGAAVQRNGIVEGQRRLCSSLVGDGQRGIIVCVAAGSAGSGG